MLFKPLALATLVVGVLAADNAAPIVKSLQTIDKDIAKLNSTVLAFDGNFFLTIPILAASTQLGNDLDAGTKTANKNPVLTDTETFELIGPVNQLSADANITLTNLIAKKPQFQKLFLTGIIKLVLQDSKKKADAYSTAVISKVSPPFQGTAKVLVAPLDAGFQQAINAYS